MQFDGNTLLSGGAKGSDTEWGKFALYAGHNVIHWSFKGHRFHSDPIHTYELSDEILRQADNYLEEANLSLRRKLVYNKPWFINLLRRNWFQVAYTKSVYAISTFNEKAVFGNENSPIASLKHTRKDIGVNGGTAWACMMYVDRFYRENMQSTDFKLYVFDQNLNKAFKYKPFSQCWVEISEVPKPEGVYTAIGTRELKANGIEFMKKVYQL